MSIKTSTDYRGKGKKRRLSSIRVTFIFALYFYFYFHQSRCVTKRRFLIPGKVLGQIDPARNDKKEQFRISTSTSQDFIIKKRCLCLSNLYHQNPTIFLVLVVLIIVKNEVIWVISDILYSNDLIFDPHILHLDIFSVLKRGVHILIVLEMGIYDCIYDFHLLRAISTI